MDNVFFKDERLNEECVMLKQKGAVSQKDKNFYHEFYGVIDKLEGKIIHARIYTMDDEFFDEITFNENELTEQERERLVENIVFFWNVGCRDGDHYSTFKLRTL